MALQDHIPASNRGNFHSDSFDIGLPEAEAEATRQGCYGLIDYFEDYLDIVRQIDTGKFIIIGRKGSGKSAIAKYIGSMAESNPILHTYSLSRNEFSMHRAILMLRLWALTKV